METESYWFGYQTLLIDLGLGGIMFASMSRGLSERNREYAPDDAGDGELRIAFAAAGASYVAGPLLHHAHGGAPAMSAALRVATPLWLFLSFCIGTSGDCDGTAASVAAISGLVISTIVDSAFLSYGTRKKEKPTSAHWTISPTVEKESAGLMLLGTL